MKFKTTLDAKRSELDISYRDKLFFIGSCFSENIGKELSNHKFKTKINPFGIIYNPISIFKVLKQAISEKEYSEKDIFQHNEIWKCFDFHSDISDLNSEKLLENINSKIQNTNQFLKETNTLFITFGTAWVYKNSKDQIVANCHKIPQKSFNKELLDTNEIVDSFNAFYALLNKFNPNISLVLTISPVRHIRDGIIENNQSKAALISAAHKIVNQYENTHYFPAYEYVIDDLRDYRFFKEDLVHPNQMALQYVLSKFETTYFEESTLLQKRSIEKVLKSLQHKVMFEETEAHQKFITNLITQIKNLEKEGFDFNEELKKLKAL